MPGLSKVIVLDPDARAGQLVRLGFEREGVTAEVRADVPDLVGEDTGLVVVGGVDGAGLDLVRRMRDARGERVAPIVFAGRGVARDDAEAAGADEVVSPPAYLRDVVTIGRLIGGVPAAQREHLTGNLVDITSVLTLVRAFAALGRSATLTLVRGLRRGEIRFFHGEVTSASVGMIHGQAALHQLLLWTDARFDFQAMPIVRRQQIPLPPAELFADAARFLAGVRESSGGLSPAMVLEQDVPRVQSFGKQIPTEVYGVLRMFDGHRALADVLEDSAYRVFETLRVTQRAVEIGLLRAVEKVAARPSWRAVLGIEEWLVGGERETLGESGPVAAPARTPQGQGSKVSKKKRKKQKRRSEPVAVVTAPPAAKDIDWGELVPRIVGAEVGPLAGVVPSSQIAGEIADRASAPSPETAREPKVVYDRRLDDTKPLRTLQGVKPAAALEPADSLLTTVRDVKPDATPAVVENAPEAVASGAVTVPVPAVTPNEISDATTLRVAVPPPPVAVAPPPVIESTPGEVLDEPSDGVIIQPITTAPTAPAKRRRPPSEPTDDDRPDPAMGEITAPRAQPVAELSAEPSILVADLAAVHSAVSAVAAAQAKAPPTPEASTAASDAKVTAARDDAAAVFSEAEEAFFRAGHDKHVDAPPTESFSDLDEGYRPLGFWDRLRGKRSKRSKR